MDVCKRRREEPIGTVLLLPTEGWRGNRYPAAHRQQWRYLICCTSGAGRTGCSLPEMPVVARLVLFEDRQSATAIPSDTENEARLSCRRTCHDVAGIAAEAAKFEIPNDQSIVISGRIDLGDEAHFLSALSRLRRGGTIEVHLSSPGGSVLAAMKIADIVRRAGLTTQVPYRATCASACVLVFAAGVTRTADADATIAVHSAGMPGQADVDQKLIENGGTLAATTLMARIMSASRSAIRCREDGGYADR